MQTYRRVFGTDGIRGEVGTFLTPELALSLGRASTQVFTEPGRRPQVLVIRDTRESGPMLEAAFVGGVTSAGGNVLLAGILPTPAASLLVGMYSLDLAVVVSASHNPFQDNGIKFFDSEGMKLSNELEAEIESLLCRETAEAKHCGAISRVEGAADDYLRALRDGFDIDLAGKRILLDCANGATYKVAQRTFESHGAEVEAFAVDPDGRNINDGVGAVHPDLLAERVKEGGHDAGFAFDGDGDRVIAASSEGEVVDGDELIALAALHLKKKGELTGSGVAVTVMSNLGFKRAMELQGVEVATTEVGDRYVSEELAQRGWVLGGEQSGHVINRAFCPSGDGIATALLTMEALAALDRELGVDPIVEKLPQCLVNVSVSDGFALDGNDRIGCKIESEVERLGGRGRVLVRASGTEPVVRIMVEAPSEDEGMAACERLSQAVREELK